MVTVGCRRPRHLGGHRLRSRRPAGRRHGRGCRPGARRGRRPGVATHRFQQRGGRLPRLGARPVRRRRHGPGEFRLPPARPAATGRGGRSGCSPASPSWAATQSATRRRGQTPSACRPGRRRWRARAPGRPSPSRPPSGPAGGRGAPCCPSRIWPSTRTRRCVARLLRTRARDRVGRRGSRDAAPRAAAARERPVTPVALARRGHPRPLPGGPQRPSRRTCSRGRRGVGCWWWASPTPTRR